VDIGHEKNKASIAVGPCFEWSRSQSTNELRRQHAHADAVDAVFLAHVKHHAS
jgi:hypothetical protein